MADLSQLINDLNSNEAATRAEAARQLAQQGEDARPAALGLLRNVADADESVVEWSTAALEGLGAPAIEEVDELAGQVNAPNADVAYWAATLLGRLGAEAKPAVEALAEALQGHPQPQVRERAAWALGRLGPAAAAARPALEQAARTGGPRLARLAQRALENISKTGETG